MKLEDANAPKESQQEQLIKPQRQELQSTEDQPLGPNDWVKCLKRRTRTILDPEIWGE